MFCNKKIQTLLMGGLGNQFFQYAASKSLKKKFSDYECNYTSNKLMWNLESVNLDFFLHVKIEKLKPIKTFPEKLFNQFSKFFTLDHHIIDIDPKKKIDFTNITKRNCYHLNGYFQHDSWYKNVISEVCDEIILGSKKKIFDKYTDSDLVISLRRSDFVKGHKALTLSYYFEALKILNADKKKKITLISEDIEFSNLFYENLKGHGYLIKPEESNSDFKKSVSDFVTMIKSESFIASNSTFAWWAAVIRSRLGYDINSVIFPKFWGPRYSNNFLYPGNPLNWREIENHII
jgi:hypothetical protein